MEEIESLSYRCRQLQEAVPMCGPYQCSRLAMRGSVASG